MVQRTALVALGANIPDAMGRMPVEVCGWAVDRLVELSGLRLVARSRWYRSAPVPPSGQPDYVNGVVRLVGVVAPHRLLMLLHAIEAEAGRVRSVANAARPLDLDLLAVDGLVISDAALTLPHPRMQDRAFVLRPLQEVAPQWVHPVHGGVEAMLAGADQAGLSVFT